MLPKSVSPKFIPNATVLAGIVLSVPIFFLVRPRIENYVLSVIPIGFVFALAHFLVRKALSYLGIPVRRRSVEQFQSDQQDAKEVAALAPRAIHYNQTPIRIAACVIFLAGLSIFVISNWFRTSAPDVAPLLAVGLFFMGLSVMAGAYRQPKVCEISQQGIRAPNSWGWRRFIPWHELVRCEIIHDDENARGDYFMLWDRAGRCRVNASSWIADLSRMDRDTIFGVLRSRFPGKAKVDRNAEPALLEAASSAVWDRELDG
jgi:hypothetical protein